MIKSFGYFFSRSARSMKRSALRDILKLLDRPGMISFAGGLPERIDTDNILRKANDRNVAFVSGSTFFCNDSGHNTMRINYSYSSLKEIETGIERLSSVIREELRLIS